MTRLTPLADIDRLAHGATPLGEWFASIPLHTSNLIPLHVFYPPTGAVMADRLCMRIDGRLYFHPRRLAELRAALANPQPASRDLARWGDDGGAQP